VIFIKWHLYIIQEHLIIFYLGEFDLIGCKDIRDIPGPILSGGPFVLSGILLPRSGEKSTCFISGASTNSWLSVGNQVILVKKNLHQDNSKRKTPQGPFCCSA